jgi:hypothetical protein
MISNRTGQVCVSQLVMDWESLRKKVRDEQNLLDKNMRELHAFRTSVAERYDDDKQLIDEVQEDIKTS